jgi:beta-lactamase regulating signal transducer with metallopeptidase domain
VRSVLLLATVWAATRAIDRAGGSAAMRYAAWLFGFVGLALLPLLAAVIPAVHLPLMPPLPTPPPDMIALGANAPIGGGGIAVVLGRVVLPLYVGLAALLLARLAVGSVALSLRWSRARPVRDANKRDLLKQLAASFGIRRPVHMRIGSSPTVPMTWGAFYPRILLSPDAESWSDEQWRIVLLHELGHVVRNDSSVRTAVSIVCAFYWANPLIWVAAQRLRREQEHACDNLVLAYGADALTYARNLLSAARTLRGSGQATIFAASMLDRSDLERRLDAIVGNVSRRRVSGLFVSVGAATTLAAGSLIAAAVPVARPATGQAFPRPPRHAQPRTSPSKQPDNASRVAGISGGISNLPVAAEERPREDAVYYAVSRDYRRRLAGYREPGVRHSDLHADVLSLGGVRALPHGQVAPLIAPAAPIPTTPPVPTTGPVPLTPPVPQTD